MIVTSKDPWLTIVTVVKDDHRGFVATVESLREQDLSGVEFIVIDGSAHATECAALVEESELSEVVDLTVEWSEPAGIYPAMNRGLELARGEYIFYLNAGDLLFDGNVVGEIGEIVRLKKPEWIVGLVQIDEQSGSQVRSTYWDYAKEKSALFSRGLFPPHQGTIVKTSALRLVGGFDEQYAIAADYRAALALSKIADPVMIDRVIARFREGGTSTQRWQESFREFHRARVEVFQPRGVDAFIEKIRTFSHFARVWLVRNVITRGRTSSG